MSLSLWLNLTLSNIWCLSYSFWKVIWWESLSFLSLNTNFWFHLQKSCHPTFLFANERHCFKFILPFICNSDRIIFYIFIRKSKPLGVSILNHLFDMLRVDGIPHIIHVWSITLSTLRKLFWKILIHLWLLKYLIIQCLHTNFIKRRCIAKFNISHFDQFFLAT